MTSAQQASLLASTNKLRTALELFHYDALQIWPTLPKINPSLSKALAEVAIWAAMGRKGDLDLKERLRGLFFDPITIAAAPPAPPAPPPLPDAAVIAVMSKLGTKGGASKSDRKIAAAKATISKVNAARAMKRAKG